MGMAMTEAREFLELKQRIQALEEEVRKLTDCYNEVHGGVSYLKGLVKPPSKKELDGHASAG